MIIPKPRLIAFFPYQRKRLGSLGTEFCKENLMTSKAMGQEFISSMDGAFDNWKPKPKYTMEAV